MKATSSTHIFIKGMHAFFWAPASAASRVPEAVVQDGPDYRALRAEKLGIPWDQDISLSGVKDPPVPESPEIPETTLQQPVSAPALPPSTTEGAKDS